MTATTFTFLDLLVVALAAVVAPMLAELVPKGLLPPVVLEVVAGIVLGPQVLGWLKVNEPVGVLSVMGLSFLLFLAGMELTPKSLTNHEARLGMAAFAAAVALSFPLALLLKGLGADADLRILALALTSTSLGVLVPVLRDAGEAATGFGQSVLATGSVGEFASLLVFTVLFSADPKSTPVQVLFVVGLAVSGIVAVVLIRLWWGSRWFKEALERLDDTTSQLRVRSAFVLLLVFAALVSGFGLDSVLGAFVAGIVLRVADEHSTKADEDRFLAKLQAIGFGFLVPVFFIATGAKLDISDVVTHGKNVALVFLILLGMVIARGVPAFLLFRRRMTARGALATGAFQATSLTFPIIVATIGGSLHFIGPGTAAALIAAGLLSVVVLPAVALLLRPWEADRVPSTS
jgi:Kef-type K+ transport system membrane component KefB